MPISTFDGAGNQGQFFEMFQVQTGTCSSPNVYFRFHFSLNKYAQLGQE